MARLASNSSQPFSAGYQPSYEVRRVVSAPAKKPVGKVAAATVSAMIVGIAGALFGFISCVLGGIIAHFMMGMPLGSVLSGTVAGGIIAMVGLFLLMTLKQVDTSQAIVGALAAAVVGGVFCLVSGEGAALLGLSWWLAWPLCGLILDAIAGGILGVVSATVGK